MAHNVTERDGVFTVRRAAWWDLDGTHDLVDYPSREDAQKIAHPWEPVSEPIYRKISATHDELGHRYEQIPDAMLNVRSDDGYPLGVVSGTYGTVTNTELWDIASAIEGTDKGSVMYETAGSLLGGKKVWILIRLKEPLSVKGDPNGSVIPYYALQNSHDGMGSFRGQATITRIVCDNTAKMADLDAQARGTEFTFRHTKNIRTRVEQAQQALAGWRESINTWHRISEHLMATKVTKQQRKLFLEEFIPMPPPHAVSDRVVTNVEEARAAIASILLSPSCDGINNNAYGLVQASIEYLQHVRRARTRETRFKRAYLDRDRIVTDAVALAEKVAHV